MNKKIFLILIIVLAVLIGLTGIGTAQTINVKFGINQDPGTPQYRSSMLFAEKVAELSEGKIKVTVYPSMQLGGLREHPEMVQTGTIEMTKIPATTWSNFSQTLEVFDIPFLFENTKALKEVANGSVGQEIANTLKNEGVMPLGYSTGGLKQMTANKPIHHPNDLVGMKFRVMPSPILIKTYESLGANPVPIDFNELYNALQQGVVDGQENPLQTVDMMKLWEVQKHLTLTNNGPMLYIVGANLAWFENLAPDLQQNIIDAFEYALEAEWEDNDAAEAVWLANAINNGMEVYKPTDEELQAFREKTASVVDYIRGRNGSDLVDRILAAAEEANERYK